MSDTVIVPEEAHSEPVVTPVEPTAPVEPAPDTPETPPTEEPEITEADLQALIDSVMKEVEEPVPLGPQFPTDNDPLSEAI